MNEAKLYSNLIVGESTKEERNVLRKVTWFRVQEGLQTCIAQQRP